MLYTEYNNGTPVFCGKVRSRVTAGRTAYTGAGKDHMIVVEIDFTSDEAIYLQLRNQIVMGIATARISEGEALPSVRQMADLIGVNMHTVNKAYTILKQEGILKPDRRRGTVVAAACDKAQAIEVIRNDLRPVIAEARCRSLTLDDLHALVDEVFAEYQ